MSEALFTLLLLAGLLAYLVGVSHRGRAGDKTASWTSDGHCRVIRTSSTAASTRLPPRRQSAAEIRMRIDWPANAEISTERVAKAAFVVGRRAELLDHRLRRRADDLHPEEVGGRRVIEVREVETPSDRVNVPVAGRAITGDWIDVVPPSMSLSPAAAPAVAPVTRVEAATVGHAELLGARAGGGLRNRALPAPGGRGVGAQPRLAVQPRATSKFVAEHGGRRRTRRHAARDPRAQNGCAELGTLTRAR